MSCDVINLASFDIMNNIEMSIYEPIWQQIDIQRQNLDTSQINLFCYHYIIKLFKFLKSNMMDYDISLKIITNALILIISLLNSPNSSIEQEFETESIDNKNEIKEMFLDLF